MAHGCDYSEVAYRALRMSGFVHAGGKSVQTGDDARCLPPCVPWLCPSWPCMAGAIFLQHDRRCPCGFAPVAPTASMTKYVVLCPCLDAHSTSQESVLLPVLPAGSIWLQDHRIYHSTLFHASSHVVSRAVKPGNKALDRAALQFGLCAQGLALPYFAWRVRVF